LNGRRSLATGRNQGVDTRRNRGNQIQPVCQQREGRDTGVGANLGDFGLRDLLALDSRGGTPNQPDELLPGILGHFTRGGSTRGRRHGRCRTSYRDGSGRGRYRLGDSASRSRCNALGQRGGCGPHDLAQLGFNRGNQRRVNATLGHPRTVGVLALGASMNAVIPREPLCVQIDTRDRRGNARRRRNRGSIRRGRRGNDSARRNCGGGNDQRDGGHSEGRGRSKTHVGKCGAGGTLSENGIQFCRVGIKRRGTVTAKCDGRLELAVVFDKGRNLRVERRGSSGASGNRGGVRVGVNLRDGVAARSGTSLAGIGQNKTGDRFALLLGQGCRVDADLHTHDVRFSES